MALYAQRVLRPLSEVTERAQAVADGDLTPHEAVSSNDEIGELARTFESMVAAIATANADLVRSERLAAVGTMAARVTHEIRNPLSSMALNVELLEEELGESVEAQALVRAIKGEVERLSGLSDQYLSLARQQPIRPEEEDPANLIEEVAAMARPDLRKYGAHLELEAADELPKVHLDEGQIKQVLLNITRNAQEALEPSLSPFSPQRPGERAWVSRSPGRSSRPTVATSAVNPASPAEPASGSGCRARFPPTRRWTAGRLWAPRNPPRVDVRQSHFCCIFARSLD